MDASRFKDLNIAPRILMGPGPSMVEGRVLSTMTMPVTGHLDPDFISVMNDVQELLRYVFQTKNEVTLSLSGTGTSGMEAGVSNFVEPGDHVLCAVKGYFGDRIAQMAERYGAQVDRIEKPWGEAFTPDEIEAALSKKPYKLLTIVHGETSTGVCQPQIAEIAAAAHQHGALLLLDTVASLGGVPVEVDAWDVDICYSGSQKALSAPPGLAMITLSPRAWDVLQNRQSLVSNWYLDLKLLMEYWGAPRKYHHTAAISTNYALREALRIAAEEGLENRFARHAEMAGMLYEGLTALDLPPLIPPKLRLATLTTPRLPEGLNEAAIRSTLRDQYNIEISGGFGPLAGKVWRIGLMGFSARRENVLLLLAALENLLP
jgi:alanine-glyoxylate transaminase/serine-glyoxylate transaminase/serine-pyruvate transaminase